MQPVVATDVSEAVNRNGDDEGVELDLHSRGRIGLLRSTRWFMLICWMSGSSVRCSLTGVVGRCLFGVGYGAVPT